jgi:hypothetical protein
MNDLDHGLFRLSDDGSAVGRPFGRSETGEPRARAAGRSNVSKYAGSEGSVRSAKPDWTERPVTSPAQTVTRAPTGEAAA